MEGLDGCGTETDLCANVFRGGAVSDQVNDGLGVLVHKHLKTYPQKCMRMLFTCFSYVLV